MMIVPPLIPTKSERKQVLRRITQRLANQYAYIAGLEVREVHRQWIDLNGRRSGEATEGDLERKKAWLIQLIKEARISPQHKMTCVQ